MPAWQDYKFQVDPETLRGTVLMPSLDKVASDVAATIASDHNGKVRSALVRLGWTPPHDARDVDEAVRVARERKGCWQFSDGDWTQGSGVPEMLADEVLRLRLLFRVNMLRHAPGATHADIDEILFPKLPDQPASE